MKYKKHVFVIFLIVSTLLSFTQVMDITWQQCFVTENYETRSYCIEQFNEGYLIGLAVAENYSPTSNYHGGGDSWFVHIDTTGTIIWEKCFGGSGWEHPALIVPIDDTFYYLVNFSSSTDGDVLCENKGETDVWIIKVDTIGDIIWQNCFGGPGFEDPRGAILTPDGGLLVMSRIFSGGGDISTFYGIYDNWLCKIGPEGELEWETTIGSPGRDNGFSLLFTSDSTYLALCALSDNGGMSTCELNGPPNSSLDVWMVELDLEGNIIRQECYGGTGYDLGWDMIEINDGYVLAVKSDSQDGDVTGYHGGEGDYWVLRLDYDYNIVWEKSLGGSDYDTPKYITQTQDGGFIVIGSTYSNDGDVSGIHRSTNGSAASDIWMVKIDSLGELIWQQCFGSVGTEKFWGIRPVTKKSDNHFVMAPIAVFSGGDVECPYSGNYHNWIFEIKDCSHYQPATPQAPTGPDTLCHTTDSSSVYTLAPASGAWGYSWQVQPDEAGTITQDSLSATLTWNTAYQGEVQISASSYNDCGESAFSEVKTTFVYTCVGMAENPAHGFGIKVYPNPAKEWVTFETTGNKPALIIVYNHTGQLVEKLELSAAPTPWNVSGLPHGLYIYQASQEGKTVVGKLVLGGE